MLESLQYYKFTGKELSQALSNPYTVKPLNYRHLHRYTCIVRIMSQCNRIFGDIIFTFLPDQAQILLDHFNVLDELWCKISFKSDNG